MLVRYSFTHKQIHTHTHTHYPHMSTTAEVRHTTGDGWRGVRERDEGQELNKEEENKGGTLRKWLKNREGK